jgi:hypothetical protein
LDSVYSGTSEFSAVTGPGLSTLAQLSSFASVEEESDFSGIGPLAGIDASYYMGLGIGAVAHADAALLIGSIDVKSTILASNNSSLTVDNNGTTNASSVGVFNYENDSTRRVVPVTDLKLGLDYTYMFNNAANSDLTFEMGWQASEYFNAIDRLATSSSVPILGDATGLLGSSQILSTSTSSLGIDGPYASLTLHV